MKLRIRGDSVRLRLTRGEVKALIEAGNVGEATRFPGGGAFQYRLSAAADCKAVGASFDGATLTVSLPAELARRWGESDEVGIRVALALNPGELGILIEKDFPCVTARPGEDDSDAFGSDTPRSVAC